MRINSMNRIAQMYQANQVAKTNKSTKTNQSDSLEISSEAKDFQTALNAVKASEETRTDRVEELKKQMEQGTYQVSNKDLAERMANRIFDQMYPGEK